MSALTEFVKRMKAQAVQRSGGQREPYYGEPVSMRFMGNTGYGEDGVLQEDNPTHMVQTTNGPRMLHEGEDVYGGAGGQRRVVPANQSTLRQMEEHHRIPGYQVGGDFQVQYGGGRPANRREYVEPPKPQTISGMGQMAVPPTRTETVQPPVTTIAPVSAPRTMALPSPTVTEAMPTFQPPPSAVAGRAPTSVTPDIDGERRRLDQGLGALRKMVAGGSEAQQTKWQKVLDDLKATHRTEDVAMAMEMAQQGVDPEVAASRLAMSRAGGRQAVAGAAAAGRMADLQSREAAAGRLAGLEVQLQGLDLNREKFAADERWRQYDAALAAGDYGTAASQYQSITGQAMDPTRLEELHSLKVRGTEAGIAQTEAQTESILGKLDITKAAAAMDLDSAQYNMVNRMISDNASLEQINNQLAQWGKNPISQAEYSAIQQTTDWGITNFERQKNALAMLLNAGGEANRVKANELLGDMFGGLNIDFSRVTDEENRVDFAGAMRDLSQNVATFGSNVNEAGNAMGRSGLTARFNDMGFSNEEISKMYNAMNVNWIDEKMNAFLDSDLYKGLEVSDPDKAADAKEAHRWLLLNPNGLQVERDEDGNVTGVSVAGTSISTTTNVESTTVAPQEWEQLSPEQKWESFHSTQLQMPVGQRISEDAWYSLGQPKDPKETIDNIVGEMPRKAKGAVLSGLNQDGWIDISPDDRLSKVREQFLATPQNTMAIGSVSEFSDTSKIIAHAGQNQPFVYNGKLYGFNTQSYDALPGKGGKSVNVLRYNIRELGSGKSLTVFIDEGKYATTSKSAMISHLKRR